MGTSNNNRFGLSCQEIRGCPNRGFQVILYQWKGVEVHTETCHPQLLFSRSIIPVRKQQISERNHLTIFHGLCLIQVFHMMVSMRLKLSSKYMLIRKMNLDVSHTMKSYRDTILGHVENSDTSYLLLHMVHCWCECAVDWRETVSTYCSVLLRNDV